VSLHLLKGIAASSPTARDGGILLQLAHSEADVAGAPAVTVPVTNNPTVAGVQQLPRTGGTPWIPMAGVGILALAVIGRRVAVRTR
jgi:LPXTG-motif cell wall-anchored protein